MGTGGRPDFGLRPAFGFRPKLGPRNADLSNFDTQIHSATRRVFWDASQRRRSPPEAETAEIRRPLCLQPRVVRRAKLRVLFLSKRVPGGLRPLPGSQSWCVSHRFFGPRWRQDGFQDGPRRPRWRIMLPYGLQYGRRWPIMAPKMPPRWPK